MQGNSQFSRKLSSSCFHSALFLSRYTNLSQRIEISILHAWLKMTLMVDSATPNRSPTVLQLRVWKYQLRFETSWLFDQLGFYLAKNELKRCLIYPQTFFECTVVPISVVMFPPGGTPLFIWASFLSGSFGLDGIQTYYIGTTVSISSSSII